MTKDAPTFELTGPDQLLPTTSILRGLKAEMAASKAGVGSKPLRRFLQKALDAFKLHKYSECCRLALEALKIDAANANANHIMAAGLERMGQLAQSIEFYERALALQPNHDGLYVELGLVAWRLNELASAEKLFRMYLDRHPGEARGIINLTGVMRDDGRFSDAAQILKTAINITPEDPRLWSQIACVVMEMGDATNARIYFEEAIRLDPNLGRAYHNLAYLLMQTGPYDEALAVADRALELVELPSDRAEVEFLRSTALFHLGLLPEAFEQWEIRNSERRKSAPIFALPGPEWQDEPLQGKRILLVAEQGLGDEIMLAHAIPDIISEVGDEGQVFIACERRLIDLFARSFPQADVRGYVNTKHNGRPMRHVPWLEDVGGVDYWATFGTTLRHRRRRVAEFDGRPPHLTPSPERVAEWRRRLEAMGPGPYVGVCWKSNLMRGDRMKYYSPLAAWEPFFRVKDAVFINLQYGDCSEDIATAKEQWGVTIHDFEDLDVKDDIDDNAALCAALDLVATGPTAAGAIAGSVGAEVWYMLTAESWAQLGTDHLPWFVNSRSFVPSVYGDFAESVGRASAMLEERTKARHAASAA
jgi:tetratricopeptide (TPR) repeat protein